MISESRKGTVTVLALLALVCAVYWRVGSFPFAGYDDDVVILNNPWVRGGLSLEGLRWSFTNPSLLWHPLVWISHMADVEFFGLQPGKHHLVNLFLHAASTVVLFHALRAMTGSRGKSAFVAALFAIHPLHVQSVVWITERKDVLSGLFWMLALAAYAGYAHRPRPTRYLAVLVAFTLGLMAKPMLVTFPFVLILLDYWPLGRWRMTGGRGARAYPLWSALPLVEKIPLLVVAAGFSVATVFTAGRGGMIGTLEAVPLWARAANAVYSYAWYLLKTAWPTALAVFYPHPGVDFAFWTIFAAAVFIAVVTWLGLRSHGRRPAFAVGWLWYLGTLFPVIGILQVGAFARADHYSYLPLIGIFVMVAWGVPGLFPQRRLRGSLWSCVAGAVVLSLAVAGSVQVGYWRDDETLFGHALAVTRGNWMIHGNLGATLMEQGNMEEAIVQFREALRHQPGYELARLNLGQALSLLGRDEEAESQFREVLRQRPEDGNAHFCLGRHLAARERWEEAIPHLEQSVRLNPGFAPALNALREAQRPEAGK